MTLLVWAAGLLLGLVLTTPTMAQESTNVPSATSPGAGRFYVREMAQYVRYSDDPTGDERTIEEFVWRNRLAYGIAGNLSLNIEVPVIYASERTPPTHHPGHADDHFGLADIPVDIKWRPFQWDLGPVDTIRLAFIAGVEIPSYDQMFSSKGFDPYFGAVFSAVLGQHGVNQSLRYKVNTDGQPYFVVPGDGSADALFYDTSYLFRLLPWDYSQASHGSFYLTGQLNGIYEVNGDNEVLLGPGLLFEAPGWAVEATVSLPVVSELSQRPRTDITVTLGFRLLF